jgi:hypothetical protein
MHMACGAGNRYLLRTAEGSRELEAVFQFRYEHFFHNFAEGYPGLDRPRERVFEPHDVGGTHYCAFDADGKLCAVSSSTSAVAPDIPPAWQEWFQFGRLASLGLERVVVSTRMVIHPDHRGGRLFGLFYRFIMERYLEVGFEYAVHYCTPDLVCRYEHHGHRVYAKPFTKPPGLLRVPMLIALIDPEHLRRVNSPIVELCAAHTPKVVELGVSSQFSGGNKARPCDFGPRTGVGAGFTPAQTTKLNTTGLPRTLRAGVSLETVLPELSILPNFRLLSPEERLSYVCVRVGTDRLPESRAILPVLEYASPLRLKAGLSHAAPPGGGFVCLVLSGSLWEQGADAAAGAGSFVGASLLTDPATSPPRFTVQAEAEILVLDQNLTHAASRVSPDSGGLSLWRSLRLACLQLLSLRQHSSGIQESKPCGTQS